MTATTTEDITVDTISMKTLAKNIETLGATLTMSGKRGANAQAAQRSGSIWTPLKPDDDGSMVWPMWVIGCDDNGAIPSGTDRTQFMARVDELTRIFNKPHALLDIRHTLADSSVRQCFAECTSVLNFTTQGYSPLGKVQVTLDIPSGYWQDVSDTVMAKDTNTATNRTFASTGATAPLDDALYTITGPVTNPRITDVIGGGYVQYNGTVASGQTLIINANTFTVTATGFTPNLANLVLVGTGGRLMRLIPSTATGQYTWQLTGSTMTAGTTGLAITGKRKFQLG